MEFTVKTTKREEIVDVTEEVKKLVEDESKEKGKEGRACLVYVQHATCAIIVNENYDDAVCEDILDYLKQQIPKGKWKHDKIDNQENHRFSSPQNPKIIQGFSGNADSHIKASIIGPSQLIPLINGKLGLGRWQGIGLAEFDGPRERKIVVEIL